MRDFVGFSMSGAMGLCLLMAISMARGAEPEKVAMTADRWTITAGEVAFVDHLGAPAMELKPGNYAKHIASGEAVAKDVTFGSGTIEYDVDATAGMGAGFAFRRRETVHRKSMWPWAGCARYGFL